MLYVFAMALFRGSVFPVGVVVVWGEGRRWGGRGVSFVACLSQGGTGVLDIMQGRGHKSIDPAAFLYFSYFFPQEEPAQLL